MTALNLDKSLVFITAAQRENGGFLSESFTTSKPDDAQKTYLTTFFTSLILNCLLEVPDSPLLEKITSKSLTFLLNQRSESWSFNYWAEPVAGMVYPDDLDDTFCALSALFRTDPSLFTGEVFASISKLLIATEKTPGGPYKTWLTSPESPAIWQDVDLAVNANIAYFLSLQDIVLPGLTHFLETAIQTKEFHSQYYPSPYPILYFLARVLKAKSLSLYILSLQNKNGYWGTPLHTALALTSLLRLGQKASSLKEPYEYLINQQKDGIWPLEAFCLDPAQKGITYYAGSSTLTTAFCLEALSLYQKLVKKPVQTTSKIHKNIISQVKAHINQPDPALQKNLSPYLKRIFKGDSAQQITLLPSQVLKSLPKNLQEKIPHSLPEQLGLASTYGWLAYTMYDDLLDAEAPLSLLPAANFCLRRTSTLFTTHMSNHPDFLEYFNQVMNKLEAANLWELEHLRFSPEDFTSLILPNYPISQLVDRSYAHSLASLAVLFWLELPPTNPAITELKNFFYFFILARQLSDDAHDWQEDLKRGQLNYVSLHLLKKMPTKRSSLEETFPLLEKNFFETEILEINNQIEDALHQASKALQANPLLKESQYLSHLLSALETSVELTRQEHQKTLEFLATF